jgi:hypothetical protein
MNRSPKRQRAQAWVALLAALLLALAPTASRSLVWSSTAPTAWMDVCTTDTPKNEAGTLSATPEINAASSLATHSPLDHCPFCLLTTDRLGPAPHPLSHLFMCGDPLVLPVEQAPFFPPRALLTTRARDPPFVDSLQLIA